MAAHTYLNHGITIPTLTRLAIGLSIVFWFLESLLHVLIWENTTLLVELITPPGHEIWMRFTIIGLFIGFGYYGDKLIAARRRAEEAANQANAELTQIFETAADGMRIVDKDFNVLRANQTFLDMAGMTREELIGKKCFDVFRGHRCDTPNCPLKQILDGEERVEYDSDKQAADGRIVPSIVTVTPFKRPDGSVVGIVEDFKDISERRRAEQEIMVSRERLRELTSHLQLVREEERSRIEREIHDELGQALAALNMDVYWLRKRLPEDNTEMRDKIAAMSELIRTTIASVRRICLELRPWLLNDFGLSAAIDWQAGEFTKRTNIPCQITSTPTEIVLEQDLSIAIYRIFQEALTNVIRHAKATRMDVKLDYQAGIFRMRISDNGKGITTTEKNTSFGLIGMQERVIGFGGDFHIDSDTNGTVIDILIPTKRPSSSVRKN